MSKNVFKGINISNLNTHMHPKTNCLEKLLSTFQNKGTSCVSQSYHGAQQGCKEPQGGQTRK